jgi:hypothetical protein
MTHIVASIADGRMRYQSRRNIDGRFTSMNGHNLFSEPDLDRARECKLQEGRLIKDRGQGPLPMCSPWRCALNYLWSAARIDQNEGQQDRNDDRSS